MKEKILRNLKNIKYYHNPVWGGSLLVITTNKYSFAISKKTSGLNIPDVTIMKGYHDKELSITHDKATKILIDNDFDLKYLDLNFLRSISTPLYPE